MSGIAVLVPSQNMYNLAEKIIKEKEDNHIILLKEIETKNAVVETREAIDKGANIIVARGRQAVEIMKYTNIPVAQIVLTAQEIGLLVVKAKKLVAHKHPKIGLFGWPEMLCDTSHFNELYDVDLIRYELDENSDINEVVNSAIRVGVDVVICGEMVAELMAEVGIPTVFLTSTGESIEVAIKNAEALYNMHEIEGQNYAQFSAVLDSSFNGIVKTSKTGQIIVANSAMEQITGLSKKKIVGMNVCDVLKGIDAESVNKVISGESENLSTFITLQNQSLAIVVEPIVVGDIIDGVIVSCNIIKRVDEKASMTPEHFLHGYIAHTTFEDIDTKLTGMREVIEMAKIFAQSSSPMLIESLTGPELSQMCECIHNYGPRKNGPYITINISGLSQDEQIKTLMGEQTGDKKTDVKGAIELANGGTLVIQSIDKMTLQAQYHLVKAIRSKSLIYNSIENIQLVNTRIIACTAKNLTQLRKVDNIRSDLYYMLKPMKIRIPSLSERPDDVEVLLDKYMKMYMEQYSRYNVLTAGAKKFLLGYGWDGNSIQLQSFCERMILTVGKRTITEEYVRNLIDEIYVKESEQLAIDELDVNMKNLELLRSEDDSKFSKDPYYNMVKQALEKYNGNRSLAAKELNISTTTLWRHMKKYELN